MHYMFWKILDTRMNASKQAEKLMSILGVLFYIQSMMNRMKIFAFHWAFETLENSLWNMETRREFPVFIWTKHTFSLQCLVCDVCVYNEHGINKRLFQDFSEFPLTLCFSFLYQDISLHLHTFFFPFLMFFSMPDFCLMSFCMPYEDLERDPR